MSKYLPGFLLVFLGIGVYLFRSQAAPVSPIKKAEKLYSHNDGEECSVNSSLFEHLVQKPYSAHFEGSYVNLVVFTDPTRDCPGDLFEGEYWAKPSLSVGQELYKLTVFVPDQIDAETLLQFQNAFAIRPQDIVKVARDDQIWVYHRLGLFKVLFNQAENIQFCGKGEDNPIQQRAFYERVLNETQAARDMFSAP